MNLEQRQNQEANLFAAYLLIPENMLINQINKMDGFDLSCDADLNYLCKKFKVSSTLMIFRLSLMKRKLK